MPVYWYAMTWLIWVALVMIRLDLEVLMDEKYDFYQDYANCA